jgi:hypothetical protein
VKLLCRKRDSNNKGAGLSCFFRKQPAVDNINGIILFFGKSWLETPEEKQNGKKWRLPDGRQKCP